MDTLIKTLITFDSAQYLPPTFGKCNRLHGHTYQIKNLRVTTNKVVDFSIIKDFFNKLDHIILSPEKHKEFWESVQKLRDDTFVKTNDETLPQFRCVYLPVDEVTVEAMGNWLSGLIQEIDGVEWVEFELYETPTQGVAIE